MTSKVLRSIITPMTVMFAGIITMNAQSPATAKPSQSQMGWIRGYGGTLGQQGPKLEGGSARWAEVPGELKATSSTNVWVEFIPISGPSIWVPGYVSVTTRTRTTDDSRPSPTGPVPVAGSPDFIGSFSFQVLGDIDGKGYRIWSMDRTVKVGEEFIPEQSNPPEMILETFRGDAVVIHVANPSVKNFAVRFSADGENWTYARGFSNHAKPTVNQAAPEDWEFSKERIPERVLSKNPNPFVEVDIIMGLHRFVRRFQFGMSPNPLPGAFFATVPTGADEDFRREKESYNLKIKEYARKSKFEQLQKLPEIERSKEGKKWHRLEALEEVNRQFKERNEKEKTEKAQ